MKSKILGVLVAVVMLTQAIPIYAKENPLAIEYYNTPQKIRCTCYTGGSGITATGKIPHYGIIAGPREWFGCAVAVYSINENGGRGDFIGWFEIDDTGPNSLLEQGRAIDLYQETIDDANNWIATYGDYVYIELIKAEG